MIGSMNYRQMGEELGLTRARVFQIAKKNGMDRNWAKNPKYRGEIVTCECGSTFLRKTGNRTQCPKCRWAK